MFPQSLEQNRYERTVCLNSMTNFRVLVGEAASAGAAGGFGENLSQVGAVVKAQW
jgi:MOSC domain-containing protein YiiM